MALFGDNLKHDRRITLDDMECVLENEPRPYSDPDRVQCVKPRSMAALEVYAAMQKIKSYDPDPLF